MAADPIIVVPYDPAWPGEFAALAARIRGALGTDALRIDHVGSTAIPRMAAKPVIDIQVSVAKLDPVESLCVPLEAAGFVFRPANPDRTKRYFREKPGERRTHIHVKRSGSFGEQVTLLFRDYLRVNQDDAKAYADLKYSLAVLYRDNRPAYVAGKSQLVWEIVGRASEWSQEVGWQPGPSNA